MKKQNNYGSPEHDQNRIYIISFESVSKRQILFMNSVSLDVIGAFWRTTKRKNCAGYSEPISRNYADVYILDILDSCENWSN